MQYTNISIKAGPKALKHIQKEGLHARDIKSIAAAAGGPKWFIIYHLTKYIGEHIIPNTLGQIQLLGSSVGAWQMACLASETPGAALSRLKDYYAGEEYMFPITGDEISRGCQSTLDKTFSDADINFILNNKKINLNIFTAKGRGILNSNNKARVNLGLFINFITNAVSRKSIDLCFLRHIFSSQGKMPIDPEKSILRTELYQLNSTNFRSCLMSTAAIPMVMRGVDYIKDLEGEVFWDGGLTDYHMALPYRQDGLVLIPHFFDDITPGWMDKMLKYRRAKGDKLPNTVLISPSTEYVKSLPKSKITTRDDFMEYGQDQQGRADYWKEVAEKGREMSEELDELITSGKIAESVQPL